MLTEKPQSNAPSLTMSLYKRFGADFIDQFFHSEALKYEELKGKKPELPHFEKAGRILKDSSRFRFITWLKGFNKLDYIYLTTESEKLPDAEGEYTCVKGYKYDPGKKSWRQVFTHIDAYENFPLRNRVGNAVSDSENQAIIDGLGMDMFNQYIQAQYLSVDGLENYPNGEELNKIIKGKNVKVKYVTADTRNTKILPGDLQAIENKGNPFYIIEEDYNNLHLIQIVSPAVDKKGRFKILFAGVTDNNTGKCLDFAKVYPNETFYLSKSDVGNNKGIKSHGLKLTQKTMDITATIDGEKAVKINKKRKVKTLLLNVINTTQFVYVVERLRTFFQPQITEFAKNGIDLNIYASAIVFLLSAYGGINIVHLLDLKAEQLSHIKLMVQSAREKGVDLMDGVPDSEIPYFSQLVRSYRKLT